MSIGEFNAGDTPAMAGDYRVETLQVTSCHRNRDKLEPDGPLGSYADFTTFTFFEASNCSKSIIKESGKWSVENLCLLDQGE